MSKKQLEILTLLGSVILILFAAGFTWLHYHGVVLGRGEDVLAYAPFWIYPYLVVISAYVGFVAERFARGRSKRAWPWGIAGLALTLVFTLGMPSLLSPIVPFHGPEIFAGPAFLAFVAPVLSVLVIVWVISTRRPDAAR